MKTAGEISKKLYEFGKSLKDRELKHQIDEILDNVRELKQSASELEDENRELREKLRFKSDAYEFRTPFYYDKARDNNHLQPLCPKCFAKDIAAPMSEQGLGCAPEYRRCLVCDEVVQVENRPPRQSAVRRTPSETLKARRRAFVMPVTPMPLPFYRPTVPDRSCGPAPPAQLTQKICCLSPKF